MQKIKINPFLKKKLDSSLHPDNPPVAEGFRSEWGTSVRKSMIKSIIAPLIIFLSGCSAFRSVGDNLGEGLMEQLKQNADTIGFELVKGVRESFTSEKSQKELSALIDSLIFHLGYSTNVQVRSLRDSLLNEYVNRWIRGVIEDAIGDSTRLKLGFLRDEVLGDRTLKLLMNMRNELLGYRTRQLTTSIIADFRNELLNDTTLRRLGAVRDVLLGPETNAAISSIVDSAMVSLVRRYRTDLSPELESDLSFIQRNVIWILVAAGIVAIVVIWVFWQKKQKYLKLTRMLTYQIYDIPQKDIKESLKEKIRSNALQIGLEADLREELAAQGILSKE
jgi:hypothetical protein